MMAVGRSGTAGNRRQCVNNLAKIVPIDLRGEPSESCEFDGQRLKYVGAIHSRPAIEVHNRNKIVEAPGGREDRRFPDTSLETFGVAQQGECPVVVAPHLGGESHAGGNGQAMSQRTRGDVDSRDRSSARVLGEAAAILGVFT